LLGKSFEIFFGKCFWTLISKRQYSLINEFYDRKQTLQAQVISILFALIDLTG